MIHLEEYLDTLEALPMELQRQFTLMRELDALSQDIQEQMKKATSDFISNPPTKDDPQHTEYLKTFVQLFTSVLKHGEEKVALATQTYDLVDKHIRKLDDDLTKFEERQLTMPPRIAHAWGPGATSMAVPDNTAVEEPVGAEKERKAASNRRNADESAATTRKRRTNNREASPPGTTKSSTPSGRRGNGGRGNSAGGSGSAKNSAANDNKARSVGKVTAQVFADMPIDPNEPRYCYCRQVSYGEMVACDDENCEIEWFHLGCVDLKAPPKGQWFCRECSQKHKKRRDHHS
ncbi:hypothetical protein DL89DRAFT_325526 [Linderina pennispora]|uniref:Chromatin modification-related protein n=1 Tax=Linderina pennispora TaxID=61395 RepID=A0A1Y1VWM0_9FUNG|nr:uncharacterized protein DL89DRAFT_325526 [Linderina pennispora]ORX65698.1 hypothetical protein DL89DRAFT_325526 [Linderina pennispora]